MIDEGAVLDGLQKVANRITLGLIIAAMIIGAAMLMRVETSFRLLGYPGLAILFFLGAAFGAAWMAFGILRRDRTPSGGRPELRRPFRTQPPVADEDAASADADARDLFAVASIEMWMRLGPQHLHALQADGVRQALARHQPVLEQVAAKRSAGATGCGILGDAELRREHAAVHADISPRGRQSAVLPAWRSVS